MINVAATGNKWEIYGPIHPEHLGEALYELESSSLENDFEVSKFYGSWPEFLCLYFRQLADSDWSRQQNENIAFEIGSYFWSHLRNAYSDFWNVYCGGVPNDNDAVFLLVEHQ